mmetsp:Transcript_29319/g.63596  ORF Transcript_29319/g.63596 Transcript_29319/m.63596 type:complete len:375 (-) Transcript_29319:375-1499(-)
MVLSLIEPGLCSSNGYCMCPHDAPSHTTDARPGPSRPEDRIRKLGHALPAEGHLVTVHIVLSDPHGSLDLSPTRAGQPRFGPRTASHPELHSCLRRERWLEVRVCWQRSIGGLWRLLSFVHIPARHRDHDGSISQQDLGRHRTPAILGDGRATCDSCPVVGSSDDFAHISTESACCLWLPGFCGCFLAPQFWHLWNSPDVGGREKGGGPIAGRDGVLDSCALRSPCADRHCGGHGDNRSRTRLLAPAQQQPISANSCIGHRGPSPARCHHDTHWVHPAKEKSAGVWSLQVPSRDRLNGCSAAVERHPLRRVLGTLNRTHRVRGLAGCQLHHPSTSLLPFSTDELLRPPSCWTPINAPVECCESCVQRCTFQLAS